MGVCVIKAADLETADRLKLHEEDTAICALSTVSQRWVAPPLHIEGGIFQPYDFLTTESLGTDLPRRCTSYCKCKECKFRTDCLTFKEDQEYQVILEGLKFNKEHRRWRATYPFHIPPTTLKDNYRQVFKYTLVQEKRLAKQGRTEEFNAEFYKTVERRVFKEITREEMAAWDSPVNYISMVEAFKEGPHSTTPLRICMNSSLKQPHPASLSLNDCLIKGLVASGGFVHGDPVHPRAQVRAHEGSLQVLPESGRRPNCAISAPGHVERGRYICRNEGVHHHDGQLWGQAGRLHRDSRSQRDGRDGRGRIQGSCMVPAEQDLRG